MNFISNFFKKILTTNTTSVSSEFNNILAAKVLEVWKHPNADRLRLVKLDAGDRIVEPVVCGASNLEVDDIVALALPGAVIAHNIHSELHESFTLDKAKIRGIESQGMICAAFELGVSNDVGNGIMHLKHTVKSGSQFSKEMVK